MGVNRKDATCFNWPATNITNIAQHLIIFDKVKLILAIAPSMPQR